MEKGALIGAGRTADVYVWGDGHVLKLYQAWMPAKAIEREFTITRLAHDGKANHLETDSENAGVIKPSMIPF